ncbi:MAG: hypothetical protein P1U38_07320 [Aeromicrobium sp.]|uniref:hypothetical protein n=1 Tax=Aeromicrobium sp. TaxID=1871063 RepID=UPI0026125295|nr:hypothetical protein [Aeromicrobium sp.]MDF1704567.1 hypothetical protein [Aeromicrobium sp.]
MRRGSAVVTGAVVLAILAAAGGCGGNDGGDTRCEEFALMSQDDRTAVVEKLLGGDPSEGTVQLTVTAATYHCLAPDARDDLVKDVLG